VSDLLSFFLAFLAAYIGLYAFLLASNAAFLGSTFLALIIIFLYSTGLFSPMAGAA